jgi:hypothetical protein
VFLWGQMHATPFRQTCSATASALRIFCKTWNSVGARYGPTM